MSTNYYFKNLVSERVLSTRAMKKQNNFFLMEEMSTYAVRIRDEKQGGGKKLLATFGVTDGTGFRR